MGVIALKVYISVDMEGLAGIHRWKDVSENEKFYKMALLEEQLRWLLEGIIESEADVEKITVVDSHALGSNIPYRITSIDERIELVSGSPRKRYMMANLDETYDRVIFFGYHAGVGSMGGIMDHTYSSSLIYNITINGKKMCEALINAGYAGYLNVPICMVVGDEALLDGVKEELKGAVMVATKKGIGRYSAVMKSSKVLEKEIKEGVKKALKIPRESLPLYRFEPPIELVIEFLNTAFADAVEILPFVDRVDGRTIRFVHDDFSVVFDMILSIVHMAYIVRYM